VSCRHPLFNPFSIQAEARRNRGAGAHMIQVSASCPLMVDRAKMPLRLVMSIGPITRLSLQRERQWPGAVSWPGRVRKRQLPPADRDWQRESGLAQRKATLCPGGL
jgi:hypothetical protein